MLAEGHILRGIYRIESHLSSGGFGNTYVATNVEFEETCAVKEFFMKGVNQREQNNTTVVVTNIDNKTLFEEQLQKFKKEARRMRKLKNPHIVTVHDLFEENETAYYVMDYIDGENLAEKIKRIQKPLPENEVMKYLPQILDALETIHKEGMWHLDLKPANIMVDRNGNVSLIDFGASKQRSSKGGATTSTAVSYTNGFAPREQMEQNLEKFGPWTDLYALGATLYNLLANQRPPMPSDIDDDRSPDKHLALPLPEGVSEKAKTIILHLMTTDRLDRPQSVQEVKELLQHEFADNTDNVDVAEADENDYETLVAKKKSEESKESVDTTDTNEPVKPKEPVKPEDPDKPKDPVDPTKPPVAKWRVPLIAGGVLAAVIAAFLLFGGGKKNIAKPISDDTVEEVQKQINTTKTVQNQQFSNALGNFVYTGEVDDDNKPNGKGEAVFDNGNTYKGMFVNGKLEGPDAVYTYKNGDTFVGSFEDDHFREGKYTVAENGEYFQGKFKNGAPDHGTWYNKRGVKLEDV